ncbi:hypothetical protein [uncultured Parasphingorhabdus sp.]|uniref:hypothetical protein n=1 Tax=uncultured Parasphingorhabdus sp. TaxID=2709694 RepID=UPI0030DA126E|tara:strand:+ start:30787 stop:31155 length:369 start_codon:yes stop_codon:yes gene_type:complete
MTDRIEPAAYPDGPGYRKDSESSKDGAIMAAADKATQEQMLMPLVVKAGPHGVTWFEASETVGDAIRPDTVRARLSSLKKAGKLAMLPTRRMGGYGVRISPYVLPQFVTKPDNRQADLLASI